MGSLHSKKTKVVDAKVLSAAFCREFSEEFKIAIPASIQLILSDYLLRQHLSSNNIVSEQHIEILSKMDIICLPRGQYERGGHKLCIQTDESINTMLKKYQRKPPKHKSLIIGSIAMGYCFTTFFCFKVGEKENGMYCYDDRAYFTVSTMGGVWNDELDLEDVRMGNIADIAHKISKEKQLLIDSGHSEKNN